jgi:oligoendopeptidase F
MVDETQSRGIIQKKLNVKKKGHTMVAAQANQQVTGAENIIWDLSVFYDGPDDPRITAQADEAQKLAETFAAEFKGRVGELDAEELRDACEKIEAIDDLRYRVYSYAALNYTTNTADAKTGAAFQKAQELLAAVGQQIVFFQLEWNMVPDDKASEVLASPVLDKYRFQLESARRFLPHQLTEAEEQILMDKGVTGASAWRRLFSQIISALRLEFDGQQVNLTKVLTKMYDPDRAVRQRAADAISAAIKSRAMELSFIFNVLAADKASDDRRRSYPAWISERNLDNLAPDPVVEALIETVTGSYELVARHYRLKRVLLGVDELYDYDRYAPLPISESDRLYTWDEARDIVLKAFGQFSPTIADAARVFFENNWIHAPVQPDKRGGAYANPTVPSAHPFVFVNFEGKASNVSTLAHELGHGMHMYLSGNAHGFQGLYTPLTTAEMASTFAEMLVFEDLMKAEPDAKARLAMLAHKVEDSFATIFRQVSMNRFEHAMHTARRSEGELPTERLNELWISTQRAMFGDSVTLRDDYSAWWSYVPHFLEVPGYVYAYAFGELLVLALYNLYKERGADFVPQYVEVLTAGGSDYPDRILAKVGIDLNDPGFWKHGIQALAALVEEEERLARELFPEKFGNA